MIAVHIIIWVMHSRGIYTDLVGMFAALIPKCEKKLTSYALLYDCCIYFYPCMSFWNKKCVSPPSGIRDAAHILFLSSDYCLNMVF